MVGVKGWLLVFVIAVIIGITFNVVSLSSYSTAFTDLASAEELLPGIAAALGPVLWFEVFQFLALIAAGIAVLVLVLQQKKIAKPVAIGLLLTPIVLGVVDYMWAGAVFDKFNLDLDAELASAANEIARSVVGAGVWIPYLMISKRVKATLVK